LQGVVDERPLAAVAAEVVAHRVGAAVPGVGVPRDGDRGLAKVKVRVVVGNAEHSQIHAVAVRDLYRAVMRVLAAEVPQAPGEEVRVARTSKASDVRYHHSVDLGVWAAWGCCHSSAGDRNVGWSMS